MTNTEIQTKKCTTCQENLPYDEFSARPNQPQRFKDGFSDICKGCMRWYRRRSYERSKNPDLYSKRISIPLRENNSSTLSSVCASRLMGEYSFLGKGVNDKLEYSLELNLLSGKWIALIYDGEKTELRSFTSYPTIGWDQFQLTVSELLFQLEIKLEEGKRESLM